MSRTHVAVVGWGSLLWDPVPSYDDLHGPWSDDGPVLPIEFSRVSRKRPGALTLVVDPVDGAPVRTFHARSVRIDPADAVRDLAAREHAPVRAIGLWTAGGRTGAPPVPDAIPAWAAARGIYAVVWTGLDANFAEATGERFTVDAALRHLGSLDGPALADALAYVHRAPAPVRTPLRAAVEAHPVFGRRSQPGT